MSNPIWGLRTESELAMTDPISNNRPTVPGGLQRTGADKAARKADAQLGMKDNNAATAADMARRSAGSDEVILTNVMQKAMDAPSYDQAEVENIKKAIKDGQYPLDPRRIAESFNALEKLIRG